MTPTEERIGKLKTFIGLAREARAQQVQGWSILPTRDKGLSFVRPNRAQLSRKEIAMSIESAKAAISSPVKWWKVVLLAPVVFGWATATALWEASSELTEAFLKRKEG